MAYIVMAAGEGGADHGGVRGKDQDGGRLHLLRLDHRRCLAITILAIAVWATTVWAIAVWAIAISSIAIWALTV